MAHHKQQAVIFDLDNCLSDDEWRIPKIDWSLSVERGRYDAYHRDCEADQPNNAMVAKVEDEHAAGRWIVFSTARPSWTRHQTVMWIRRHIFRNGERFELMMRNDHDHRPSALVKREHLEAVTSPNMGAYDVVAAYDDNEAVLAMYRECGIDARRVAIHSADAYTPPALTNAAEVLQSLADSVEVVAAPQTAADILAEAAETYRQRNAVYGSNFRMIGPMMKILFPDGVPAEVLHSDQFHLFELVLVKISRYAVSNLTHIDSMRDAAVYAAMCESINHQQGQQK